MHGAVGKGNVQSSDAVHLIIIMDINDIHYEVHILHAEST